MFMPMSMPPPTPRFPPLVAEASRELACMGGEFGAMFTEAKCERVFCDSTCESARQMVLKQNETIVRERRARMEIEERLRLCEDTLAMREEWITTLETDNQRLEDELAHHDDILQRSISMVCEEAYKKGYADATQGGSAP